MDTRANQQGGGDLLGSLTQRLASAAQQYLEAQGEQVLRNAGQRLTGVIDNLGDGSMQGQATKEAAKQFVQGGSPARAILSGATGAVKSVFGGDGKDGGDGGDGGGGGGKGAGSRKSINIIEDIDVGVPLSVAYNQWTQFQELSSFMQGVEGVDVRDEIESNWRLKIGPSRRSWEGQVTEEVPDRRIAWTSQGAKGSTKGVVSFHPLADDLTRVIVVMEYTPVGPFEKVGSMMRLQLRRVRLDLREFKKFISMQNEETGSWRGEIRDGEVVRQPDEEGQEQDEAAAEEEQPEPQGEEEAPEEEEASEEEAEPAAAQAAEPQQGSDQESEEAEETEEAEEAAAGNGRQQATGASGSRTSEAQRQRPARRRESGARR